MLQCPNYLHPNITPAGRWPSAAWRRPRPTRGAGAAHGELAARYEALAADPSLELPGAELADEELTDGELPDNLVQPYVELPALRAG